MVRVRVTVRLGFRVRAGLGFRVSVRVIGLGLGLVSGSSLVGVCRHLVAVVWSTYTTVVYTTVVYMTVVSIVDLGVYTTVMSVVCKHDGRVRNIHDRRLHDDRVYSGVYTTVVSGYTKSRPQDCTTARTRRPHNAVVRSPCGRVETARNADRATAQTIL